MVEQINRFKAEEQRGIVVLFQNDGGRDGRLEAVSRAGLHDASE